MWVPGGIKISVFCTESCTGLATAEVSTVQKHPIIQHWTIGVDFMKLHLDSPAVFLDIPVSGRVEHWLFSAFGRVKNCDMFFLVFIHGLYMSHALPRLLTLLPFPCCTVHNNYFFFLLFSFLTESFTSCIKVFGFFGIVWKYLIAANNSCGHQRCISTLWSGWINKAGLDFCFAVWIYPPFLYLYRVSISRIAEIAFILVLQLK